MNSAILKKMTCISCNNGGSSLKYQGPEKNIPGSIECVSCGARYHVHNGIPDLVGDESRKISLAQWFMELPALTFMYERIWRPLVTIPFSSLSWELGQARDFMELAPDSDLLDIACGPGNFTLHMAERISSGSIVGIDMSASMLRLARKNITRKRADIHFIRSDVTRWPFRPDSFHRIFCAGALHLFPDIASVMKSIYSSLKDDGIFAGATYLASERIGTAVSQRMIAKSGFHWFSLEELRELCAQSGFADFEHAIYKTGIVFRSRKRKGRDPA